MRSTKRRLAAIAAVGAAAATVVTAAGPAMADKVPVNATGNTTFQIASPYVKALSSASCGTLQAVSTGDGALVTVGKGSKIKVTLPVSGIVVAPDTGNIRIVHSGGFELSNDCYDVRLTNFYIQDFGTGNQFETADVLAKTKDAPDFEDNRTAVFTLDLSEANATTSERGALKIRSANLDMGQDGTDEFNYLVTGDPTTGPFYVGEQIGKARLSVKLLFSDITSD